MSLSGTSLNKDDLIGKWNYVIELNDDFESEIASFWLLEGIFSSYIYFWSDNYKMCIIFTHANFSLLQNLGVTYTVGDNTGVIYMQLKCRDVLLLRCSKL